MSLRHVNPAEEYTATIKSILCQYMHTNDSVLRTGLAANVKFYGATEASLSHTGGIVQNTNLFYAANADKFKPECGVAVYGVGEACTLTITAAPELLAVSAASLQRHIYYFCYVDGNGGYACKKVSVDAPALSASTPVIFKFSQSSLPSAQKAVCCAIYRVGAGWLTYVVHDEINPIPLSIEAEQKFENLNLKNGKAPYIFFDDGSVSMLEVPAPDGSSVNGWLMTTVKSASGTCLILDAPAKHTMKNTLIFHDASINIQAAIDDAAVKKKELIIGSRNDTFCLMRGLNIPSSSIVKICGKLIWASAVISSKQMITITGNASVTGNSGLFRNTAKTVGGCIGIYASDDKKSDLTLDKIKIEGFPYHPCVIDNYSNVAVSDCIFTGGFGVYCMRSGITARGNLFEDTFLFLNNCTSVNPFSNNRFLESGICLEECEEFIFSENIVDGAVDALTVSGCRNCIVENCTFYHNKNEGIILNGGSNKVKILNCSLDDDSMLVEACSNCVILNNFIQTLQFTADTITGCVCLRNNCSLIKCSDNFVNSDLGFGENKLMWNVGEIEMKDVAAPPILFTTQTLRVTNSTPFKRILIISSNNTIDAYSLKELHVSTANIKYFTVELEIGESIIFSAASIPAQQTQTLSWISRQ